MKLSRATQYWAGKWAISDVLCTTLTTKSPRTDSQSISFQFQLLFISRAPLSLCFSSTSSRFSSCFLFTSHLCCQPATQIRNIQAGVKTSAHKILTACRIFYVATFFFIFGSVSTCCGTVIWVHLSSLMPLIRRRCLTASFLLRVTLVVVPRSIFNRRSGLQILQIFD